MAYTRETERLVRLVRADLKTVTDQQVRDLVGAWADAWNEVSPDLTATLLELLVAGELVSRTAMMRSERLRKVLIVIAEKLDGLAESSQVRIIGDLQRVIDIAGAAQTSVIDSQLPPGHLVDLQAWIRVDAAGIEAIVRRTTEDITSRFRPLSREAQTAVRRELVRGYAAGSNPRQTAHRIITRTQGRFNGGLNRALAIARTETLDASRQAAYLGRSQNADVLRGWAWHCELSPRSCTACISMDGAEFPLDYPGPDDHVNGRCTGVPITKSWADLGFDGIEEPPPVRQSGSEWFDGLDASTQRQILGPSRYDAWRAGDYPMSDWAHVQHNDGWRDSLQTTKVPAGYNAGRTSGSSAA